MKFSYYIILLFSLYSFSQKPNNMPYKYTNSLIKETSPYLLQHAHNPVDWFAWNNKSLETAKSKNKLIIISVGYAACHWCHVMEHESFEDLDVAKVMNENYINIKVDREERPDIDQVYMNAVQIMTGQGGWPMNVIALPDGRPIWGGTYFKKEQWLSALEQIAKLFEDNPNKLEEYATKLTQGVIAMDTININNEPAVFDNSFIDSVIKDWSKSFDRNKGGMKRAPKFMMPNNYHFLLRYAYQNDDSKLLTYINSTLTNMAYGGVYDQIGGGFSRYSVDTKWHVPHFEKMLYDNGQLVSLYADAYSLTKNDTYKDIVIETLNFIERELTDQNGAFYSSLDADSITEENELVEGAFYVWTKEELKTLLNKDYNLFSNYYNVNAYGYWENKNYVLIKSEEDISFCKKNNISLNTLKKLKENWKKNLLAEREKRNRPRLDDKILTSWNALMLKGYIDAYKAVGDKKYLEIANKNANFLINNLISEDGGLFHNYKNEKATINGFLEDYSTTIEAFISLYEVTLNEKWLKAAKALTDFTLDSFFSEKNKLFYFTSTKDTPLISRVFEYRDNVIPASNSILAKSLYKLSHYYDNTYYYNTSLNMLNTIKPEISTYGSAFSNWLDLMLNFTQPFYEIAVIGTEAKSVTNKINKHYLPNKIIIASSTKNNLPLLKNRFVDNKTLIYVCQNKTCKMPTSNIKQAIQSIKN